MRRLLVTGAAGMLGQDVVLAAREQGWEPVGLTHAELDVSDAEAVAAVLAERQVHAVVNCAAYTAVDAAESDAAGAAALNETAVGVLAGEVAAVGARLVHVSTDYVFDGDRPADGPPYVESDATGPRSVYGSTKLAGERAVAAAGGSHAIARTQWLFGVGGRNFAATMLALGADRDEVTVVTDQIGIPTATAHLARALVELAGGASQGVHHVAGGGEPVSWHGFTVELFRQAGLACAVRPCTTAEMPRPAPRPAYSALRSERAETPVLPPWQDGVSHYLATRKVHA